SVDEPLSGRKPSGDEIDVLVAVSEHAVLAVEAAQEAARAQANREALQRLLDVSTRMNETWDSTELLTRVCGAISDALGFEKVAVQLLTPQGVYETTAQVGFTPDESIGEPLTADQFDRLLQPEHEVAGCFVLDSASARAALPDRAPGYTSQRNGRSAYA